MDENNNHIHRRVYSEEERIVLSNSMKGNNNPNFGKRWVNKNNIVKIISIDELLDHLNDGWIEGKKYKNIKSNQYGKCWINKNNENKFIHKSELDIYLEMGWIKGRIMNMMKNITV